MATGCAHIELVETVLLPKQHVCQECVKIGSSWVHLRTCQTCGMTLCCDSSPNRHATKHFHASRHPIVTSVEPGEDWTWCYVDDRFLSE